MSARAIAEIHTMATTVIDKSVVTREEVWGDAPDKSGADVRSLARPQNAFTEAMSACAHVFRVSLAMLRTSRALGEPPLYHAAASRV